MIKEVRIRSRKDMKNESYRIDENCIIISINDLDKDRIIFPVNSSILDVHYEWFEDDDANTPESISENQALAIAEFAKRWDNKNTDIICYVNCEAGMSRSAGVGAAIARYFLGDDDWIFRTKIPNRRCYRMVLDALYNF